MASPDAFSESSESPLLTVPEASRVLRIGRQLGYQLAHEYLASGGTSGLPVVRFGRKNDGHGTITLPRDYVRQHLQLAYATTEPGAQGDTSERSLTLATNATTRRGLYMAMTRGQRENLALVVTNTHDLAEARAVLEAVLFSDRADIPATVQRRNLAATVPASVPQRRVRIPDWFDQVRAGAEEGRRVAQQRLDERNTERAAARENVAAARQELPAAQEAHAPFAAQVALPNAS